MNEPLIPELPRATQDGAVEAALRLRALFPECVTEGPDGPAVDFDLLRQALTPALVEGPAERYRLDWPGKRAARNRRKQPDSGKRQHALHFRPQLRKGRNQRFRQNRTELVHRGKRIRRSGKKFIQRIKTGLHQFFRHGFPDPFDIKTGDKRRQGNFFFGTEGTQGFRRAQITHPVHGSQLFCRQGVQVADAARGSAFKQAAQQHHQVACQETCRQGSQEA